MQDGSLAALLLKYTSNKKEREILDSYAGETAMRARRDCPLAAGVVGPRHCHGCVRASAAALLAAVPPLPWHLPTLPD